jgi:uracil-DNA glycosylase family 4
VRPDVIVTLGATAARSVLGRITTITALRGRPVPLEDGATAFATIHPSALLRIHERADRDQAYRNFVTDLKCAAKAAT